MGAAFLRTVIVNGKREKGKSLRPKQSTCLYEELHEYFPHRSENKGDWNKNNRRHAAKPWREMKAEQVKGGNSTGALEKRRT